MERASETLFAFSASDHEVPRLTTMLRAFTTDRGSDIDVDQEFLDRSQKLKLRGTTEPRQLGGDLMARLFGRWETLSRGAKDAYEVFLKNVGSVTMTEVAAEELQQYVAAVWEICEEAAPSKEDMRKRGARLQLNTLNQQLKERIGVIEEHAVQEMVLSYYRLKELHSKEGKQDQPQLDPPREVTTPLLMDEEFGSEMQYNDPLCDDPRSVLMAMCDITPLELGESVESSKPKENPHVQVSVDELTRSFGRMGHSVQSTPETTIAQRLREEEQWREEESRKRRKDPAVGVAWIDDWCREVNGASDRENPDLAIAICSALVTSEQNDQLAQEIGELIGWDHFDYVQKLVEKRVALKDAVLEAIKKSREMEETEKTVTRGKSLSFVTESEQKKKKKANKGRRKDKGNIEKDLEWMLEVGFEALLATQPQSKVWLITDDMVTADSKAGSKGALPQGATRNVQKGCEEICIPAMKAHSDESEQFVAIDAMEEWAQKAFEGYRSLNRIQSRIYPAAFHSNENLLVCAPTGAGKTNIAMIAILREIGQHIQHGVVQKTQFKIVYVAPMKALAAEMTATFSKRLQTLGIAVRELTGDMQLTKSEMAETQVIVTTPEKWDVITRKGGDVSVAALVKLLIIDEVHLLNDSRGPVIETIVARTLRQVEMSQSMIRIVGLSATLPNFKDVAHFLVVNLETGLFFFDASYRPVPLAMQFIGVSEKNLVKRNALMNQICYEKVVHALRNGKQAMVFVHSRKETGKTGRLLAELSDERGTSALFSSEDEALFQLAKKDIQKSRNREMVELFQFGIGMHHAGMLRSDRNLMERNFSKGMLKVLVCTATLAWGVNLPAHTVIIKGTQLYDSQKGQFTDVGLLDVQQIFGRAGRPQFDVSGEGIIITTHNKLADYLGMLTSQIPIESKFANDLVNHLNAEIVLGTVSNLREATTWLSYTYMHVRSTQNPLAYGITWESVVADRHLEDHRRDLIAKAARELNNCQMARFDERSGQLYTTDLGRVASHYYIHHESIRTFNAQMHSAMSTAEILTLISESTEFEQMMVREEELQELDQLAKQCPHAVKTATEEATGKVNVLLQTFISGGTVEAFSLVADMMHVSQNAPRIGRALFEICMKRGWSTVSTALLDLCKGLEQQLWPHLHPLRQFGNLLPETIATKLDRKSLSLDDLYEMETKEIQQLLNHPSAGIVISECLEVFPRLDLNAQMAPITRSVVQVRLELTPRFRWNEKYHGTQMKWLVWVDDSETERIYHQETWMLSKSMMKEETHKITFAIPISEPLPSQYIVRVISDSWLGAEASMPISFKRMILPGAMAAHTELLDLDPLPLSVLKNELYEGLYSFSHFNPIQTQVFHTLYHTDKNVLLGAPTGSGKTISAELAMLRLFTHHPGQRVVYIAPLKALVRERLDDWGNKLCPLLKKRMIELTGDYTPDIRSLSTADIIVATPEKWDGISRNWQSRSYVRRVGLMVMDEIHLLGADRGPIIEVIVSRMRYIASQMKTSIRLLGLSTALANAEDVAEWMGVDEEGLFNFRPSVRPVPLECHLQGFPGKFYCPRMASMNKPAYAAIQTHAPTKPVLVFVSSRRQTRLTALDLIAFAAADQRPTQFLRLDEDEVMELLEHIKDANLKHTLQFGIGMHHAGLNDKDRSLVERLYVEQKIRVLVATSTLAWGVNTPAHLVIIKGTEYFDAPTRRYVDMPITDILQMMGRAGRPQYDAHGVAVIMVHAPKKAFYKKFLYEPFPVESSLPQHVSDHLNAEIVAGTIGSKQGALDYLTWTYFFRRLLRNPSFYSLDSVEANDVNVFLSDMVETVCTTLEGAGCVKVEEDGALEALTMGKIASFFYIKHETMAMLSRNLNSANNVQSILQILCHASEYDELPVRHNEDKLNALLAQDVRWPFDLSTVEDPHTKTNLLLQAHLSRLPLPITDYVTDTKGALDNSVRLLQAMVDIAADAGWLVTVMSVMSLIQSLMQARWFDAGSLMTVPHINEACVAALEAVSVKELPDLIAMVEHESEKAQHVLSSIIGERSASQAIEMCRRLPLITIRFNRPRLVKDSSGDSSEESRELTHLVEVELECHRLRKSNKSIGTAFTPRFPKIKDESWWLMIGRSHELLALKRLSIPDDSPVKTKLKFLSAASDENEEQRQSLKLFLMSDCYQGLDQEYALFY